MKKIVILISGTGSNMLAILDATRQGKLDASVELVVSSNHNALGLVKAREQGIMTAVYPLADYSSNEQRDQAIVDRLATISPDYIVTAGYLGIISPLFVAAYRNRIINIHPSLLPKYGGRGYYGLAVHEAVIASGDKLSGATVHLVDEGTDTGRILAQEKIAVSATDTPTSLQNKILNQIEHKLLISTLQKIINKQIKI